MIENAKQQQLTFEKGITNVPSDAICSDNALEECVGLTFDNGEHRVIQQPFEKYEVSPDTRLLYVHSYNGIDRYIVRLTNTPMVAWARHPGSADDPDDPYKELFTCTSTADISVESIGNTLIFKVDGEVKYFVWKNNKYVNLDLSELNIDVKFSLDHFSHNIVDSNTKYIRLDEMLDGRVLGSVIEQDDSYPTVVVGSYFKNDKYEDAKTALIGLVSLRLNEVKEKKCFAFPFWARYAVRLFDGSYTYISNPVLLLPTVRNNWHIFTSDDDGNEKFMDNGDIGGWPQTSYQPTYARLMYKITHSDNVTYFQDVVSGIDIFVSDDVMTFDLEGKWTIENCFDTKEDRRIINELFESQACLADKCTPEYIKDITLTKPMASTDPERWRRDAFHVYFKPTLLSDDEIVKRLLDQSVFYKIIEHDINELPTGVTDSTDSIRTGTLKTLTTQQQLPYDDYYSRTKMKSAVMKTYNNRLHLGNVSRGFFEGFGHFSFTNYVSVSGNTESPLPAANYTYVVYIDTPSGQRIVEHKTSSAEIADIWFFYPDPRAKRVEVYLDGTQHNLIATLTLKRHPLLNGAYAFMRLPSTRETRGTKTKTAPDPVTYDELLEEHIFVSEADNPWVFTAKGDITTKMGAVIGMATQTMSLGELEHGFHPMTVFGAKGISLLRIADDGTYSRSDEISREVANQPNPCIVETDGPVFFASAKGLMVVLGSQVQCVSEQLSGRVTAAVPYAEALPQPFPDYLRQAFIAYDYRDSLLWIFKPETPVCWVYNIKTKTFAHYDFGSTPISNIVNCYPDYLLQSGQQVFSLLSRPNINSATEQYSCQLVTRPMKLENALALKSIVQVLHISQMEGTLSLRIFGSNNLLADADTWHELQSLGGTPFKYYKFKYSFTDMKATDRFAGTVVLTVERRTNKLR